MKYVMMVCLMAFGTQGWAATEQVENFTAKIFTAKGTVEYLKKDTTAWTAVKAPFMLEAGDQVKTGPKSKAEIYIKYGAKIRLNEDTTFVVTTVAPGGNAVEVLRGKMTAWVRKFAGRNFTVRTPSAVCAVRGTVFGVEVTEAGQTTWDLFNGSVQISDNRNQTVDLQPNQRLQVTQGEGAAAPAPLPADVKAPSEPSKTAEEKAEIKAEKVIVEQKAKEEAAAEKKEEAKEEEKEKQAESATEAPELEDPVSSVIPTQEVEEACTVSASDPDCI